MISAFAPGRLELIGNHTDYNDGYVMAIAVNLGVTIQGQAREDNTVVLRSQPFGEDTFSLDELKKSGDKPWSNYFRGVLEQLQKAGAPLKGFEAEISSTLPSGAGMSSSAALEVATLLLAQKIFDFEFGDIHDPALRVSLAAMCRAAENDFVGVKCGILDQVSSMMGRKDHAVFIDCRTLEVQQIPLSGEVCFVVCHTGAKHMLLSSKYNQRHSECMEAVKMLNMNKIEVQALRDVDVETVKRNAGIFMERVFRRAMHVVTENGRVLAARDALANGDILALGKLMYESHESSRDAFENSTEYLDQLVEIARGLPGCLGARLTGGGFGGATINLVYRDAADQFMTDLMRIYREKSGKEPQAWKLEASDGAE
ncbi:MAG: galactokinase [Verrucomicrobiae bacterium]|nr:galactokinase [Verrucomicrobiae bacterium]